MTSTPRDSSSDPPVTASPTALTHADTDPTVEPDVPAAPGSPHEAHLPPGVEQGPATLRAFRLVVLNTLIASVTTNYLWFALTFWAYLKTRSVMTTSIIGGSFMLLMAITSMYFGGVVDRHRKKPIMIVASVVPLLAFALAGGMFLAFPENRLVDWTGPVFWVFVAVILLGATIETLRNIALSTTVTLLVPPDERDKANGLVGTVQGVAFMVTSVFSGLSVGLLGMGWTVAISVALTAISLGHLLTISIPEARPHIPADERRPAFDVRSALEAIRAVPGLMALIFFATFNNLIGGVFMALMDPYGLTLFSVQTWGVVLGLTSLGFIMGGGYVAKFGLGAKPLRALLLVNVGVAVLGMTFTIREAWWLYAVGMLAFMCIMPIAEAAEQTILQRVVPYRTQGRVFGFAQSVETASSPISAFLIGPIAQFWLIPYMSTDAGKDRFGWLLGQGQSRGIALVFVLAGVVLLVTVIIAFIAPPYRILTRSYDRAVAEEAAGQATQTQATQTQATEGHA